METLGTSERMACRAVSQPRATQRRPPRPVGAPEELLRQRLREISKTWPRWGFRRVGAVLQMEGWKVNHKRVQRLWREEGLRVPRIHPSGEDWAPARSRRGGCRRSDPTRCGHWTSCSTPLPMAGPSRCSRCVTSSPRESVGGLLGRSITADDVVAELDRLRLQRGGPNYIRCDNGPEFVAQAIRDWCRFSGSRNSHPRWTDKRGPLTRVSRSGSQFKGCPDAGGARRKRVGDSALVGAKHRECDRAAGRNGDADGDCAASGVLAVGESGGRGKAGRGERTC